MNLTRLLAKIPTETVVVAPDYSTFCKWCLDNNKVASSLWCATEPSHLVRYRKGDATIIIIGQLGDELRKIAEELQ